MSEASRLNIAKLVDRFIRDGKSMLIHGYSRVVNTVLLHAARANKYFSVYVTEGRPDCAGIQAAEELIKAGIPVTLVLDSAVGYVMEKVDFVLSGAEGVVENGGIINKVQRTLRLCARRCARCCPRRYVVRSEGTLFARAACAYDSLRFLRVRDLCTPLHTAPHRTALHCTARRALTIVVLVVVVCCVALRCVVLRQIGTYQIAMIARALKRPFSVAAESYKFARLFPLCQSDLPETRDEQSPLKPANGRAAFPAKLAVDNPSADYTPPAFITLLFTDLGILTPSAVSDELIKLYY